MSVSDLSVGSELLGYRVEGVLGRGGMSVVYLAEDLRLKRRVALKLLAPALAEDEAFRERFLVESELAASLDHPNIVPIYVAGEASERLFIAMRYVEGSDLKEVLRDGPLAPERTVEVCGQVAAALDFAHERGLVHRDVKPSNVLLDGRGHVYLADFGLTKRLAERRAVEPGLFGTIDYIAPEQIRGEQVDGRADVYSLGCLLCECLTGEPPFRRPTDAAVLFAHLEEQPPAPHGLGDVVAKALAKEPDDRYATCAELVDAAREALGIGEPPRSRWMRLPLLLALTGIALIAATLLAFLLLRGAAPGAGVHVGPNSVAAINPRTDSVVASVPVGIRPGAITSGLGSLWVANVDDQTVSRVDPTTLQTSHTISVGAPPTGIAATAGGVWVATSPLNPYAFATPSSASTVSVSRVDPAFNTIGSTVRIDNVVPGGPVALAAHGSAVWAAPSAGLLTQLDQARGRIEKQIDPNANPTGVALGDGAVWLTDSDANNVTRVSPAGPRTTIAVGNGPTGIAVGEGDVWVADSLDNTVVRIDPSTRAVANTIAVGRSPRGVAIGAGSVWVANSGDGTVSRIDARTHKVLATIHVGGSPQAVTVAGGRAWVTVDAQALAPAGTGGGGTLRIDSLNDLGPLDPALAGTFQAYELLQATCAKLLNFPDKPAPAGLVPTPEVARSLPAVSDGGRTYTFTIRPGFRFSPPSNQAVTAQTFKDTLERSFNPRMQSGWSGYFTDIVGLSAYAAGKADHISGIVARGDTLTIHLLASSPDLPARLTVAAMCAAPSDTPVNPNGVNVIPMAGPYYVQSFTPGQGVVLVSNPNYHGGRPHHFARIEVRVEPSLARAVAAVKAGTVDDTTLVFSPFLSAKGLAAEVSRLVARYGPGSAAAKRGRQQYFIDPCCELDYFAFNTHRALFADPRLRQAVSYAIDRRALAALGAPFDPLPAHPTDHYLPPGMPGYLNAHVYPLTADPAKAKRLASGHGRTAVLYTCNAFPCPEQAQIVKTDLAAIGLRVKIKAFTYAILTAQLARPGGQYDLGLINWAADFPDPYAMVNKLLQLPPTFDDPTWQPRLAATARLSGPRRYLTYGKLDLNLARSAAPLLAYGNEYLRDFSSARIGCQTYGFYGIDLAALCPRHEIR